ncbi:hypothetical protein D7X55_21050, partial [Corallococcus sp. AB049A]|uniref:hypothetical protein n=1 Tax=Corallococcus sp. AB049A TaxID=2316721 RepID=UPI000EE9768B
MRFAPDVVVDLTPLPDVGELPFSEILYGLLRRGFEPGGSRRLLEDTNARLRRPLLRPGAVELSLIQISEP